MPLSKRARLAITFSLLAATISGAVVTLRLHRASSDLDLLRKSTRHKNTENLFRDSSKYFWLNNQDMLAFPSGPGPRGDYPVIYSVVLGTTTTLVSLNHAITPRKSHNFHSFDATSPDGKWFLTWDSTNGATYDFDAYSMDGSTKHNWKPLFYVGGGISWMPDSSGYATIERGVPALVIRLHRLSGRDERIVLPTIEGMEGAMLLGITPDAHVVLEQMSPNSKNEVSVAEVRLYKPALIRKLVVQLPQGGPWQDFKLSPDGKHICYTLNIRREKPKLTRVQRIFSFFHPESPASNEEQLWVASLDGTERRQVGAIDATRHFLLKAYRWTPDSKRISFLCDDTLWTVPAG